MPALADTPVPNLKLVLSALATPTAHTLVPLYSITDLYPEAMGN